MVTIEPLEIFMFCGFAISNAWFRLAHPAEQLVHSSFSNLAARILFSVIDIIRAFSVMFSFLTDFIQLFLLIQASYCIPGRRLGCSVLGKCRAG